MSVRWHTQRQGLGSHGQGVNQAPGTLNEGSRDRVLGALQGGRRLGSEVSGKVPRMVGEMGKAGR